MSADVRDVGKGGDPRKNGKDQRDQKHDPFWCFQSRHVAPRKKTWARTPKRIVLATRCQVGADASAALAGGYIRRSSAISMLRQPSNDEKISDKRMSRRSCAHPQNYHRYLAE